MGQWVQEELFMYYSQPCATKDKQSKWSMMQDIRKLEQFKSSTAAQSTGMPSPSHAIPTVYNHIHYSKA